jgi:hypothetical protein
VPAVPVGNGGIADHYYWTQTLTEVTVSRGAARHRSVRKPALLAQPVRCNGRCTLTCLRGHAARMCSARSPPAASRWPSRAGGWVLVSGCVWCIHPAAHAGHVPVCVACGGCQRAGGGGPDGEGEAGRQPVDAGLGPHRGGHAREDQADMVGLRRPGEGPKAPRLRAA